MGQVWVAVNIDLDAHVAIKLLRAGHRSDAADRLKREARVLARVDHPAIVRVLDSGQTDDQAPFLVTELLHGETLSDLLGENRRLNPERAVQTLLPVLDGLQVVHERGIVHRDLKPANVFLARLSNGRRQPKVLDFGIASVREGIDSHTTAEGELLGSPVYMSPEQARGLGVDARTDIWALSVILYEMVTGSPPFEGKDHHAVLQAVVKGEPRTLAERGIDELALWAIIRRGLAKNPDHRWKDAKEFGEKLADWLVARGVREDLTCSSVVATWISPASSQSISSYPPPVVLNTGSDASRESETLVGEPSPVSLPESRRSDPATGRFYEVSVCRVRPTPPGMLIWLGAGVLVGAIGALIYASMTMAPPRTAPAAGPVAGEGTSPLPPNSASAPSVPSASASNQARIESNRATAQ